jgi:undecaprenyl pyrophosphate phosphatase UppP
MRRLAGRTLLGDHMNRRTRRRVGALFTVAFLWALFSVVLWSEDVDAMFHSLPLWATSTLVVGGIAFWTWALRRDARTARSKRRAQAGLCPACGYDLRASPERCPECGAAAGPA